MVITVLSVPFSFVAALAGDFGAVDCSWRESDRAFTGFVAEVWFCSLAEAGAFARRWAAVVGVSVLVRRVSGGAPGAFAVSVPCFVPQGQVALGWASRGSRVRLLP